MVREQPTPVKSFNPFDVPYSDPEDSEAEIKVEGKNRGVIVAETADLVAEPSHSGTGQGSSPDTSGDSSPKGSGDSSADKATGDGDKEETSSGFFVATGDPPKLLRGWATRLTPRSSGVKQRGFLCFKLVAMN